MRVFFQISSLSEVNLPYDRVFETFSIKYVLWKAIEGKKFELILNLYFNFIELTLNLNLYWIYIWTYIGLRYAEALSLDHFLNHGTEFLSYIALLKSIKYVIKILERKK